MQLLWSSYNMALYKIDYFINWIVIRGHRWKTISPVAINVTVPWSVLCLSVTFVYCALTAVDFFCIRQPRLFWNFAYIGLPLLPQIYVLKWPTICLFEHRRHSMANCGRMVRDRAMVTLESLSQFRVVTSLTIYVLSFPPNGSPQYTPQDQLRNACCHLANMITDIDKAAVCCAGCHYELSDVAFFAKLLWPLNNEIQLKNNLLRLKLTFRPRRRPSSERSV